MLLLLGLLLQERIIWKEFRYFRHTLKHKIIQTVKSQSENPEGEQIRCKMNIILMQSVN